MLVVGDEHALPLADFHPVFQHVLLETTDADATIDDDGISICRQIVTIAATAASEAEKGQLHCLLFFRQIKCNEIFV